MKRNQHLIMYPKCFKQRGVAALMFAIALPIILVAGTYAADFGQIYVIKSELQNASDACALAALQEIDSTSVPTNQLNTQTNAAKAVGVFVAQKNLVGFQKSVPTITANDVVVDNTTNAGGPYVTCTSKFTFNPTFLSLSGYKEKPVIQATSKAGFVSGANTCAIPLVTCGATPTIGRWYTGSLSAGNVRRGSFGNASKNKDLSEVLTENDPCNINYKTQQVTLKNGNIASLLDPYNTRFGIYKKNAAGIPDFTGAYASLLSLGQNAYSNYLGLKNTFAVAESFNGNGKGKYDYYTSTQLKSLGINRRVVVAPHFNVCPSNNSKTAIPDSWDCVLMINPIEKVNDTVSLEYLGSYDKSLQCSQSRLASSNVANTLVPALVN